MFRFDQKGVSLPLVLAILGLVIANTYYFMDVEKITKEQNIKRGSEIENNSEKIRLASFLADVSVCSHPDVFGNRTLATINSPAGSVVPLKKTGANFLEPAVATGPAPAPNYQPLYSRGSLRFINYNITATSPANPELGKRYSLIVTYSIINRADQSIPTYKTKVIRLPLYIVFNGGTAAGVINTCYTEADEGLNTVSNAVDASCKGNTALYATVGLVECQHNQINKACLYGEGLIGVKVDSPTTKRQEYTCGHPQNNGATGSNCTETPIRELLGDLQNGDIFVCKTTDPSCPDGRMFVMGSAGAPVCVSYCAVNQLLKSVNSVGAPNCISRPSLCPVGEYTETITAGGSVGCKPYTLLNKTCSAGKVATDVDPTAGSAASGDTVLNCQPITKDKDCATSTETTFVQSFATVTPTCNTY
jgi:hypothetical protein